MKALKDQEPEKKREVRVAEDGPYRIILLDSTGQRHPIQIGTAKYVWNRDCPNPYDKYERGAWEIATLELYRNGFQYDRAEVYVLDVEPVQLVAAMQFQPGRRRGKSTMTFTFD